MSTSPSGMTPNGGHTAQVFSHLEENFGDHAKPEELWHLWSDRFDSHGV